MPYPSLACAVVIVVPCLIVAPAPAQTVHPEVPLTIAAGRTLPISLDQRVRVSGIGQPVAGTLVEPVFAYDRIVIPAGTRATGRVATIAAVPRGTRVRAMVAGDFTPSGRVELAFDELILGDGRRIAIQAHASAGVERVALRVADQPSRNPRTKVGEAAPGEATRRAAVAPGKRERLTLAIIRALPLHPLLLAKGTVYSATLMSPIDFGTAVPMPQAPADAKPAPASLLRATLVTGIGSAVSTPGTRVEAVLTRPVVDASGRVLLPEGTMLIGQVTAARPARRFHRHGQLRLLFERVRAPDRESAPLLAALHAVETASESRVSLDEEGGATSSSSTVRFAAPALAALSLVGATHGRLDYDTDGLGPEMQYGGPVSGGAGGVVGLGLAGIGANWLGGRWVTLGLTAYGLARTAYTTIFGAGREILFPSGTTIEVQLAPGPGEHADALARQP